MERAYCPTSGNYWSVGKQESLSCLPHHCHMSVQHLPPQLDWNFSRVRVMPRAQDRCSASQPGRKVGGSVTVTHMHTAMPMHTHTTWNKSEHGGMNEGASIRRGSAPAQRLCVTGRSDGLPACRSPSWCSRMNACRKAASC